jgi:hypothetical protein
MLARNLSPCVGESLGRGWGVAVRKLAEVLDDAGEEYFPCVGIVFGRGGELLLEGGRKLWTMLVSCPTTGELR